MGVTYGSINNDCRLSPKPIRWDYLSDPDRLALQNVYAKLFSLRNYPPYLPAFTATVDSVSSNLEGGFKWEKINSAARATNAEDLEPRMKTRFGELRYELSGKCCTSLAEYSAHWCGDRSFCSAGRCESLNLNLFVAHLQIAYGTLYPAFNGNQKYIK